MPFSFQSVQSKSKTPIAKLMSILGAFTACVIAVAIPSIYCFVAITETQRILMVEAAFLAKSVERIIQSRPDLWEFESVRLTEFILQPSIHGEEDEREIRTTAGKLVAKTDFTETRPIISVSATFFDSGQLAGSIVVRHSIRTQIITTALIGILSSLLGCLIYFIFRTYPIRQLENTLAELQRERDKSDKTLYAIGDGVITVGLKGEILFINRVAESLVGMDTSEAVGRQLEEVYVLRQGQENQVGEKENILTSKGGNEYAIEEVHTPLTEIESDESEVVIAFRDITKRKRTEEALQRAHDELEQRVADRTEELMRVNEELLTEITERKQAEEENQILEERLQRSEKMEALGTLAGGVAHDLNNVLGIVVGYAEMLLMDADKLSSIRPNLVNIMNGGQRAAAIVDDLLTLARRGVSGRDVLNLNKIIAACQQSPEFEKLLFYHPSVKIKADLDRDLLNISGSSVHIGKTLFNLVSNASEAMPKGGIVTIKTTNQYLDKPISEYDEVREGDYVVLSVSDTGEGISAADLKRIFEPFYTKKVMGRSGTGLGLAVVWGTVKDHHGYINVESEEEKGSTFALYFPVTREDITAERVSVAISEYMGQGEFILVVDDVKELRDLATGMLRTLNYNVSSVSSGEEALTYMKEHEVDLIVLDMIMDPGMDGLDTYRSILEICPKQKAIIVSGFSESDRVHATQGLGAGAYVRKPYIKEKLGLAVRNELERSA